MDIDQKLWNLIKAKKAEIVRLSREGKILETLEYVEHFQGFMNYFRHCDLNYFSDP